MDENKKTLRVAPLPFLALRDEVIFPDGLVKIDVGRDESLAAVQYAAAHGGKIVAVTQRDPREETPDLPGMYGVGIIAEIQQAFGLPDGTMRLLLIGVKRVSLVRLSEKEGVRFAHIRGVPEETNPGILELEAYEREIKARFASLMRSRGGAPQELIEAVNLEKKVWPLIGMVANSALGSTESKQSLLESNTLAEALEKLADELNREREIADLERRIHEKVHTNLDQHQREYYLNEQLNVIHEELGDDSETEGQEFQKQLEKSAIAGIAREKTEKELKRFLRTPQMAPESVVSRNYVETMLSLPWGVVTKDRMDTVRARKILDEDHYGLEKVKKRIIEFLAVGAMKGEMKGPILCLVGPPGVGKTSIARSVARALDRKFVRMSLGGLRDEAEIRGHRRTYIGALPGRIVTSIRQAGTMNPVFLLDEIDKITGDFRGDPASALLEALDPEQNTSFDDHYLDAPLDLSKVLFLTTANSIDGIPGPLFDRMEVIEIAGYTMEEKLEIAKRHLLPKQLKENGLKKSQLRVRDEAIRLAIDNYTREAGVRSLERTLGEICRQAAVRILETPEEDRKRLTVTEANLTDYLGKPRFVREDLNRDPTAGVVNGLAWTPFGGETLSVEALVMPGKGAVDLTGQLGDVMKESARAAYSYIRAHSDALEIPDDFHDKHDLHIHVPEGATPKDGPSAGVAMTCAMVSAITGRKARQDIAMTGEITLSGRVLPIGGVKEKLLAAYRMGIREVLLPDGNRRDLDELPKSVRDALKVDLIGRVDQAFDRVLTDPAGGAHAH